VRRDADASPASVGEGSAWRENDRYRRRKCRFSLSFHAPRRLPTVPHPPPSDVTSASTFTLRTLGRLRLTGPEGELLAGRRKELALLAYLARRAPAAVPRATLAALLWGERGEERARNSLRQALFQLRRALGDGVAVDPERVALVAGALSLDLVAFESDVAAGRFAEAVARWEGEFLAGMDDAGTESFGAWLVQERAAAARRLASAFQQLVAAADARDQLGEGIDWAARWLALVPDDERAAIRLVELLRRAGRHDEAAARHAAFDAFARHELGREPSAEFQSLAPPLGGGERSIVPPPASPGSAALFTPDLVGRGECLDALTSAWLEASAGRGTACLVDGEMGIGRSRLHEALRRLLAHDGDALVLHARGMGGDGEPPWSTARDLLAPLGDVDALGGLAPAVLSELSVGIPALAERFLRLRPPAGDDVAVAEAVRRALEIVAEERPVAVLVDDVHRADRATRRLLLSLALRPPARVFVVLGADSGDVARIPEVAALWESRALRRIRLRPLAVGEVETMVGSMLELADDQRPPLAARLHAETGGNPFWISELVASMVDAGTLVLDGTGVWRLAATAGDDAMPLPASAREIVGWRLARLGPDARALLGAAARLGSAFTAAALARASHLSDESFETAVDELLAQRFLRQTPDADGYEFAHAIVRRAAMAQLPAPRARRAGRRRHLLAAALLAVVAIGLAALTRLAWSSGEPPVVAVGAIRVVGASDSAALAPMVRELLATDLAQVPGARLVATPKLRAAAAANEHAQLVNAARQAGAKRLVEGTLVRARGDEWRLDLRLVDLGSGTIAGARTVHARDLFTLVDDATSGIAEALGLRGDGARIAEVTTRSLPAYRFYEEGLRTYYGGDERGAHRLFAAALREDTSFAMAAFYASRTADGLDSAWTLHERAMRLAVRATDRERLLIVGSWAAAMDEPRRLAIAETLAVRYPDDADGQLLLGEAKLWAGDFLGAVPRLRRVVEIERASGAGAGARCLACDAYGALTTAYTYADSLPAAERVAREWIGMRPAAADARVALAYALEQQGRLDDALAALRAADSLAPGKVDVAGHRAGIWLRRGDFRSGDQLWAERLTSGDRSAHETALWSLAISYRVQGRLREALEVARRYRRLHDDRIGEALPEALVLLESGAPRAAAAIFDSIARVPFSGRSPARDARARLWNLVHLATAQLAAGDTSQLAALADTVEALGRASAYERDRRAHAHVRGLLFAARGRWADAAAAFQRALFSPWGGYVRTNVELGRALVRSGRARQAIPILDAALRGPIGASGLYATRSELQVLLGEAYEAAGRPDSAAALYARAVTAWRLAEGPVRTERERVRRRLAALGVTVAE